MEPIINPNYFYWIAVMHFFKEHPTVSMPGGWPTAAGGFCHLGKTDEVEENAKN